MPSWQIFFCSKTIGGCMKSLVKVLLCLAAFSPFGMNAQFCGSSCNTSCNPCCGDEYYFSVWGGGNSPWNNHHYELDTGWYVGGAIGMRASPNMRYDISFDYLRNKLSNNSNSSGSNVSNNSGSNYSSNNDINHYVVLANAYYEFCPWGCVVPFVGGGIGYAFVDSNHNHNNSNHRNHRNAFAWQVGGGLSYEINECWSASAQYRLLGATHHRTSYHNLYGVALTRRF
jgi:opacity protein-like surface antigen